MFDNINKVARKLDFSPKDEPLTLLLTHANPNK